MPTDKMNMVDANDRCCNPFEDIKEAHDEMRNPDKPDLTYKTTKELMRPQSETPEGEYMPEPPKDLAALMAQVLQMNADRTAGAPARTTPGATQAAQTALQNQGAPTFDQAVMNALQPGEPLSAAVTAMRNTPEADYAAQRNIAMQQGADAATRLPTATLGQLLERNAQVPGSGFGDVSSPMAVLAGSFGSGAATPEATQAYSQLHGVNLPDERRTTFLPGGGTATTQTAAGRDALVAARKARYAASVAGTTPAIETKRLMALRRAPSYLYP